MDAIVLSHYAGVPAAAVETAVTDRREIAAVYRTAAAARLRPNTLEPVAGGSVTTLTFRMTDGGSYRLVYLDFGGGRGTVRLPGGEEYRTSLSADSLWESFGPKP